MTNTLNYGFPKPDIANDIDEEFFVFRDTTLDMIDAAIKAVADAAASKAAIEHSHEISDVIGLAGELADKMPASRTFSLDSLTDVEGASAAANGQVLWKTSAGWQPTSALAALGEHGHLISEITGLDDALDEKADAAGVASALDNRLRFDAVQSKTHAERGQARANIGAGVLAGHRNKIINGDFSVVQRALPVAVAANSSGYTLPRWFVATVAGITASVNRVALAPGHALGRFFGQFAFSGTGVTGSNVRQRIEGVDTLAGKRATVTFGIADTVATAGVLQVRQVFGTGGSPSGPVTINTPIAITNTLTKQSVVVDIPSITGKIFGTNNDDYLEVSFIPTVANAHTLSLARVSVVEGDATAEEDQFSPRDRMTEQELCRWFFEFGRYQFTGYQAAGGGFGHSQPFNSPKRISPSLIVGVSFVLNTTGASLVLTAGGAGVVQSGYATAAGVVQVVLDYSADAEIY